MSRKKQILKKMALVGLGVAVVSAAILLLSTYLQDRIRTARRAEAMKQYEASVEEYRNYLNATAKRVNSLPVDPKIVSDAQTRYFEERDEVRLYMWAMDVEGDFLFGVPVEAFARLNRVYDTYRTVIDKEGHFTDRQDFLRHLVQFHKDMDFEHYEAALSGVAMDARMQRRWEQGHGSEGLTFSAPFLDPQGQVLGNLYLKIVDLQGRFRWYSEDYEIPIGFSAFFLVVSMLFLWFLLPTWVYLDARGRGMTNPARWSALTLVSLIFGLTVYLILRPDERGEVICQNCGRTTTGGRYCAFCGGVNASEFCGQCGYPTQPEWTYCPNCQATHEKAGAAETGGEAPPPVPSDERTEGSETQP